MLTSLFEPLMVVFMTAGDGEKWRSTPASEKRLLLGRRLAQVRSAVAAAAAEAGAGVSMQLLLHSTLTVDFVR